ncbi:MAG: isochorismatase family protein [Vulcanimicrobiota bacterium]
MTTGLVDASRPFLEYLENWVGQLPTTSFARLIEEAGGPRGVAVLGVDLVNGFCKEGALASSRVGAIVTPSRQLVERAHGAGVRDFFFPCDAHPVDSPEFEAFPPHCLVGTPESSLVSELSGLPFADLFEVLPKGSISALVSTGLQQRLYEREQLRTLVCVGDCSDLCLYHMAAGLRFVANARKLPWKIVVEARSVDTYDLPVDTAAELGILPHPGDFLHVVFLYHLRLIGVEVVARVD